MDLASLEGHNFLTCGHLLGLPTDIGDCLQLPLEPESVSSRGLLLSYLRLKCLIVAVELLFAELALLDLFLHPTIDDVSSLEVDLITIPHE